jgi:hypothetical protein
MQLLLREFEERPKKPAERLHRIPKNNGDTPTDESRRLTAPRWKTRDGSQIWDLRHR